ncbi:hypothetical protein J6590_044205 [Homalodisca vitripennis]|nr:hypothetical protein J6590_044205 [Homalodisca vitripennis]
MYPDEHTSNKPQITTHAPALLPEYGNAFNNESVVGLFGRTTESQTFAIVMVTKGITQHFVDWNLSSSSGGGGIRTYENKNQRKKGKGKGSKIPKRRCHCTECKSRAQVMTTGNTITHHTDTDDSGILQDLVLVTCALTVTFSAVVCSNSNSAVTTPGLDFKKLLGLNPSFHLSVLFFVCTITSPT